MRYTLTATWDGLALTDNDQGNIQWKVKVLIADKILGCESKTFEVRTTIRESP